MQQYLDLLQKVKNNGVRTENRTGIDTIYTFGETIEFDLLKGFPLVTTKKIHIKSIIHELLWFLSGDTNIKYLNDNGVTIWNEWADEKGYLGPIYGAQWTGWEGYNSYINQIEEATNQINNNPNSRRIMVNSWAVHDLAKMSLPPCHYNFQFNVNQLEDTLDCLVNMRSVDLFLGLPFNIASYAFLLHMFAQQCDLKPGKLIFCLGNTHIYVNHLKQVQTQLYRMPKKLPVLEFNRKPNSIFEYKYEDFLIKDYNPHPAIKGDIAV